MSDLYEKSLRKLELDQVLQLLSDCAGSQEGKDACLRLMPSSDLDDVQAMLNETTAEAEAFSARNCWQLQAFCVVQELSKLMLQRMIRKLFWILCFVC